MDTEIDTKRVLSLRDPKRGFSLVELLVVIAIISTLAAMLLPGLQQAFDVARQSDCANRMRQLHVGESVYESEYRYVLPALLKFEDGWGTYAWSHLLQTSGALGIIGTIPSRDWGFTTNNRTVNGQLRASSPFLCPNGQCLTGVQGAGNPIQFGSLGGSGDKDSDMRRDYGSEWSYAPNFTVSGPATGYYVTPQSYVANSSLSPRIQPNPSTGYYDRYFPVKIYRQPPSRKLFLHEGCDLGADGQQMGYFGQYPWEVRSPNVHWRNIYQLRHQDLNAMNLIFMDGHVMSLPFSTIYDMVRDWSKAPYAY